MARLPVPGNDKGSWGSILNDFLMQSHDPSGSLKDGVVTEDSIADDSITEAKLDAAARSKLNTVGGTTNLTTSATASAVTVASDTGSDASIGSATTSAAGVLSASDKTKLDGISIGATANSTDAQLRDRATHTGSQAISTIVGLQTALDGKAASGHSHVISDVTSLQTTLNSKANTADLASVATSGSYNDLSNRPTIPTSLDSLTDVSASGATPGQVLKYNGSGWAPAEDETASGGSGGSTNLTSSANSTSVTIASDTGTDATINGATTSTAGVMVAADKTKLDGVATGATANSTDAQLRERSTHTGSQAISTVSGLQTALDGKAATSHAHAISDVTNLQTTLDGKAASSHTHSASQVTSGVLSPARLGAGTADGTTYLRGDGVWATVVGGGGNGGYGPNWVAASSAPTAIKNAVTAAGGYVCDGTADQTEIAAALTAYEAVYLTEGNFAISSSINMPQGRALIGSGIRATRLNGASGLSGQFISITSDHTQVSRMTISGNGQTANGIDANVTSQAGFTTGADACVVLSELVLRNIGGDGIIMRGSNNRDSKISNIHVWNASGRGYLISCPDGSMMQCIAGTCGSHGFEVSSASNWRISQCKSWFSDGDGFYLAGTRCIFESLEAQDNEQAGIRMVGNLCTLTNFTADSNSYISDGSNDNVHSGLEIGRLASGASSGGYSITINGGQAWDKNEASRGYKQRAGVRIRSGVRSLTLIGVDTGDPTGTHHNVEDGIIFDTPTDLNHATNTIIARSHAVRIATTL